MLKLCNIDKTYNHGTINETNIFSDFSLTIKKGQFVSVVGSNGSGKTSVLNIICGSVTIDSGDIIFDDRSIKNYAEYKRSAFIGRVYQDTQKGTCPSMTILENMSMADNKGKFFGFGRGVNKSRTDYYREQLSMLRLGLEDKLNVKVGSLSGGQRQALALIMSTMTPIDLLILDEHTAALDPKTSETIMELTDNVVREKKLTTLMVTHNLKFAVKYGNRILMMHEGKVIIDEFDEAKKNIDANMLLQTFNNISIECGN